MSIEKNASKILTFLYPKGTRNYCEGAEVAKGTGLAPDEINDAIEILESNGFVDLRKYFGTAPFRFGHVAITSHGRFAAERTQTEKEEQQTKSIKPIMIKRTPEPVGSPYGFTEEDWEYITEEREDSKKLKVVFGYQFKSEKYDTVELGKNIEKKFKLATDNYNDDPKSIPVTLDFILLGAGYGEHMFNGIAREIISADIAVFETSDLNPNVMLEMGVALTWGVRVLPIRSSDCPLPPSDISGQTWAAYVPESHGAAFEVDNFETKLNTMVKWAAQKKVR